MVEFAMSILILAILWKISPVMTAWFSGVEDDVKVHIAESAVDRVPKIIELNDRLQALGTIPNIDEIIAKSRGSQSPTYTNTSNTTTNPPTR